MEPGPEQWNERRGTKETVSTDDGRKIGDGPRQLRRGKMKNPGTGDVEEEKGGGREKKRLSPR